MSAPRLGLALDHAPWPDTGRIAVFEPRSATHMGAMAALAEALGTRARIDVIARMKPDHTAFEGAGFRCVTAPEGPYVGAVVFVPRAKPLARALVSRAIEATEGGPVLVDGGKTDGVDSLLKDAKKRSDLIGPISKAHGKAFWITSGAYADWAEGPARDVGGFVTRPGVFSADGVDPASALLAQSLPDDLGAVVADLGAGWGYLSSEILKRASVKELFLVEADHVALGCARQNITDPRAVFDWADVLVWPGPKTRARGLDCVVMNPPFHTGRAADPSLGQGFIETAAQRLAPSGRLYMVANRHLPYENLLTQRFGRVEEIGGDGRFKILCGQALTRPNR